MGQRQKLCSTPLECDVDLAQAAWVWVITGPYRWASVI